jgi:LCP family protein required for cell wall assembly
MDKPQNEHREPPADQTEPTDQSDQADQPGRPDEPDTPDSAARPGPGDQADRLEAEPPEPSEPGDRAEPSARSEPPEPSDQSDDADRADRRRRRRRRRARVVVGVAVAALLAVGGGAAALTTWRQETYDRNIQRLPDALPPPTAPARPVADPGHNWLLVGSDLRGRSTPDKWRIGEAHSDAIMLLHLPESGRRAYVISIPRDAWVAIPGRGMSKIKDAFAYGGARLLTETVEQLTRLRVDHVAAIDFQGFRQMTDALGGVEVELRYPVSDPSNAWSWPAGRNRMNGDQALRFVRERKGLPGSDVDRVKRQQAFLKAMAEQAASTGTLTNPVKLDRFLAAVSRSIAVDATADFGTLRGLGLRLAELGPENVTFVSVPIGSTAWVGDQNIVLLDTVVSDALFKAVREGRPHEFVEQRGLENDVDQVL